MSGHWLPPDNPALDFDYETAVEEFHKRNESTLDDLRDNIGDLWQDWNKFVTDDWGDFLDETVWKYAGRG